MFRNLLYLTEYAALNVILLLFRILPFSTSTRLLQGLASVWFHMDARHRRIAIENILRTGIAASPEQARLMAENSFRHFALLVLESLHARKTITLDNWRDYVETDMPEETFELLCKQNQGLILASGHFGNWEIAALVLSFLKPTVGITRNFKNPYINRMMLAGKPTDRFRLTPKHNADNLRLIRALRQGELLAILVDQHAMSRGMMIPFFGHPASTHTSPALLHLVTGIPICFGYCVRTGPMKFKLIAGHPFIQRPTGNRETDVKAVLEHLTTELEQAIRKYPDQYLWAHRRWRPPKTPPANVPNVPATPTFPVDYN